MPGTKRSKLRWPLAALASSAVAAACATGCVDPQKDYQAYLDRTADARSTQPAGFDASFDGGVPDGGFSGNYFMAYLPSLAQGNAKDALLFQANVQFVDTGAGGTMTLSWTPLQAGATDLSQTAQGATSFTSMGSISAGGQGSIVYAMPIVLPGSADPITSNEIDLAPGLTFDIYLGASDDGGAPQICAQLSGNITSPLAIALSNSTDFVQFRAFDQPSGPLPVLQASDYHCP